MVAMDDFEVGQCVGRRRPDSVGESDVIRVVHRPSGEHLAMKRIEVAPDLVKAHVFLHELTRTRELGSCEEWIMLKPELCFVHAFSDQHNIPRARCCIVEELAERNLEQELVVRAAAQEPFDDLLKHIVALLHGIQAYHAQGLHHHDVSSRNIFMKGDVVKLGPPGLAGRPPAEAYYRNGECNVYSADIFALGLVFLEMVLLHPISDFAGDLDAVFREHRGSDADSQTAALCDWLESQASLLGPRAPGKDVATLVSAMLAWPPCARPTADDLLEWPAFAVFADPLRILPVHLRPCVVMAHRIGASHLGVPRRSVMALPELHQIFSHEGAESAAQSSGYRWCGRQYKLWWFESDDLDLPDTTVLEELAAQDTETWNALRQIDEVPLPPTPLGAARGFASRGGADMLVESAPHHCIAGRMLAGEVLCRAALQQKGGEAAAWLALADVSFMRGSFMTARQYFERAKELGTRQNEQAWAQQLVGHCEFFVAIDALKSQLAAEGAATGAVTSAVNTALYLRFLQASEAANWEVLVGLGEFYRLVGCPPPSLDRPDPHASTALSYFKQAWNIKPGSAFVQDRILRLDGLEVCDSKTGEVGACDGL